VLASAKQAVGTGSQAAAGKNDLGADAAADAAKTNTATYAADSHDLPPF